MRHKRPFYQTEIVSGLALLESPALTFCEDSKSHRQTHTRDPNANNTTFSSRSSRLLSLPSSDYRKESTMVWSRRSLIIVPVALCLVVVAVVAPITAMKNKSATEFSEASSIAGSDFPSMVPSDLPSMMPSDAPSLTPSDAPSLVPVAWPAENMRSLRSSRRHMD